MPRVARAAAARGTRPVDPMKNMQSEFIKFRATRQQKARLEAAAEEQDTSVSALLRVAASHLAAGRPVVKNVALDFAKIRRTANAVLAKISDNTTGADAASCVQIRESMSEMKLLADKYLDDTRC